MSDNIHRSSRSGEGYFVILDRRNDLYLGPLGEHPRIYLRASSDVYKVYKHLIKNGRRVNGYIASKYKSHCYGEQVWKTLMDMYEKQNPGENIYVYGICGNIALFGEETNNVYEDTIKAIQVIDRYAGQLDSPDWCWAALSAARQNLEREDLSCPWEDVCCEMMARQSLITAGIKQDGMAFPYMVYMMRSHMRYQKPKLRYGEVAPVFNKERKAVEIAIRP